MESSRLDVDLYAKIMFSFKDPGLTVMNYGITQYLYMQTLHWKRRRVFKFAPPATVAPPDDVVCSLWPLAFESI